MSYRSFSNSRTLLPQQQSRSTTTFTRGTYPVPAAAAVSTPTRQPSSLRMTEGSTSTSRRSFSTPAFPRPPSGDVDIAHLDRAVAAADYTGAAAAAAVGTSATSKYSSRIRQTIVQSQTNDPFDGSLRDASKSATGSDFNGSTNNASTTSLVGRSEYVDRVLGFQNLGNTCFMNATLQCLLRARLLRRFFMQVDMDRDVPRDAPLTTALRDIVRRMFTSSAASTTSRSDSFSSPYSVGGGSTLAPSAFKQCLSSYRRAFAGYEQHDAHEFLRFALDGVHEECNLVTGKVPYEELKDIAGESPTATANRWLANHNRRNRSIVQDVFQGQYLATVRCHTCNTVSSSAECFLDMSLQMPTTNKSSIHGAGCAGSITESFKEFFADTRLAGDDAFRCPSCKGPKEATRKTNFFRLPDMLVVHMKRFRHSRFHASKINDAIDFPVDTELNLAPYCHPDSPVLSTAAAPPPKYVLTGVVHHMGSVHGGHYIAHCNTNDAWYEFDDSTVSPVRRKEQITAGTAYILFYQRVGSGSSGSKL